PLSTDVMSSVLPSTLLAFQLPTFVEMTLTTVPPFLVGPVLQSLGLASHSPSGTVGGAAGERVQAPARSETAAASTASLLMRRIFLPFHERTAAPSGPPQM